MSSNALVPLDPTSCPLCGHRVVELSFDEPALIRGGGYGATRRTTVAVCMAERCRWHVTRNVTEVRPERRSVTV